MICFPNAKLNIGLFVTEKRADGFHNLETIFFPIPLNDALEINLSAKTELKIEGLTIAGDAKNNLIWKAWDLLRSEFPDKVKPLKINLIKAIPMGAGMGGGSADAAFMLQLVNNFFNLDLSENRLAEYALQLGSDCPFFIYNKPRFASGRGEVLEEIELDLSKYSIQLICPELHISTSQAFGTIEPRKATFDLRLVNTIPIPEWKEQIINDFEKSIFEIHPVLAEIKAELYRQDAVYAAMSGTGSTVFGIFEKTEKANIKLDIPFSEFYF